MKNLLGKGKKKWVKTNFNFKLIELLSILNKNLVLGENKFRTSNIMF